MILLGRSVEGRRIEAFEIGRGGGPRVLVLGGTHGDEPKSVYLAKRLIGLLGNMGVLSHVHKSKRQVIKTSTYHDMTAHLHGARRVRAEFDESREEGTEGTIDEGAKRVDGLGRAATARSAALAAHWLIVPCVNPDGYERRGRRNARDVDLNRNFPTENWAVGSRRSRMYGGPKAGSEPETRAVMRAVKRHRPAVIVTIHSIDQNRYCVNYDGPARAIARRMAKLNGYPLAASIGYPTPGSFGTWAGIERHIPTITLELPSHQSGKRCWEENERVMLAAAHAHA